MAKEKNPAAVALGRLGGLKGGKSTSPAKQEAARRNGLKNKKKTSFEEERDRRIKENSILADAELA